MAEQLAFLQAHLEALEQQSESWKKPHQEVMQQYELADTLTEAVAFGLYIYKRIMRLCRGDETDDRQVTVSQAEILCNLLQWWYDKGEALLDAIEESERRSFAVECSDDFRDTHRLVGGMMHGVAKLRKNIQAFKAGDTKSLGAVMNELQN